MQAIAHLNKFFILVGRPEQKDERADVVRIHAINIRQERYRLRRCEDQRENDVYREKHMGKGKKKKERKKKKKPIDKVEKAGWGERTRCRAAQYFTTKNTEKSILENDSLLNYFIIAYNLL